MGIMKEPLASVAAVRWVSVSVCVTVTSTPCTTAPVGSETVPEIVAVFWALKATTLSESTNIKTLTSSARALIDELKR